MDSSSANCEIIDVEPRLPPGVTRIIGQGTSSFVGLVDGGETVLKYPLFPEEAFRIEIEHRLLEHVGPHARIIASRGLTPDGLLLDYAENGSLDDYLPKHGNLSTTRRIRLCVQIAEALVHLHSRCVCHGDLRPGNVLLDAAFGVKLADLQGTLTSPDGKAVTLDGLARESAMYYMPRDQDRDYLDARTDLFAFGSSMHFVMTGGQAVFPDLAVVPSTWQDEDEEDRDREIHRRFVQQEYPGLLYPGGPIVRRCWQGAYASAEQLLMDLTLLETELKQDSVQA